MLVGLVVGVESCLQEMFQKQAIPPEPMLLQA
jgi:hypothetical protein